MTDQTADDLTAQANALYEQALALRRVEEQAVTEATWQAAGEKADAYWDLLDIERPPTRSRDQWLAIHAQQIADGTAPPVPPPAVYTHAQLCYHAILCQEDGVPLAEAITTLTAIAHRSGLTAEQTATALACYEDGTGQ